MNCFIRVVLDNWVSSPAPQTVHKETDMRIRLRPYHPTYLVGYYGMGGHPESYNSVGFNEIIEKIKADPDIEVEFVEGFDDICLKCSRIVADEAGSVWGERHRCPNTAKPEVIQALGDVNRQVLEKLGMEYGSVIKLKDLVGLLRERIGVLFHDFVGGAGFQDKYEHGLAEITKLWK